MPVTLREKRSNISKLQCGTTEFVNVLEEIDVKKLTYDVKKRGDGTYPLSNRHNYKGRSMKSTARDLRISTTGSKKELYDRIMEKIIFLKSQ